MKFSLSFRNNQTKFPIDAFGEKSLAETRKSQYKVWQHDLLKFRNTTQLF